jgi:hypothetical protein
MMRKPAPVCTRVPRAAALMAAMLALAVVPGCAEESGDGPAEASSPTPSRTVDESPPAGGEVDLLADVSEGDLPSVPYLERADELTELVRPDGSTIELPRAYDQFVVLGEEVVAAYDDQGDRRVDVLDADSRQVESHALEASFVVDTTGDAVAWAAPDGGLWVRADGETVSWGNQGGPVTVGALVEGADGVRVYVENADDRPVAWVDADGSVGTLEGLAVSDAHPDGLVAVQTSSSDDGSCSGVYDGDELIWETCEHTLFRFSPDGRHVQSSDPYLDGLGLASVGILDAETGDPLVTYRIDEGFVAHQIWEDDAHLLAVVSAPDGWSIMRLGLDGTRERAVGPLPQADDPTLRQLFLPGSY